MYLSNKIKPRSHIPKKTKINIFLDHILATILPITGFAISQIIGPPFEHTLMLVLLPIIAISAWLGGLSAGVLSTIVSVIILNITNLNNTANEATQTQYLIHSVLFTIEGIFLSFIVDILKHRERIRKYKLKEKELRKTIIKLEEKNVNYEKEIQKRNEFLSIASHELKTPLTSMLLQTQSALHNIKNVSVAKFSFENLLKMLQSVENQTHRLSRMINDLLSVSVITSGNLELEYEKVDLENLVNGILNDFKTKVEKEKINIVFNSTDKLSGYWDKIRLEQAVANFISNAIKYGERKPIEIILKKSKKYAELTVKDYGIGISRDKQKKIFELFNRGVPSDKYKGLGIGLFITQKIVNAHGGFIEVKSKPGKGSEFKIVLPIEKKKLKL